MRILDFCLPYFSVIKKHTHAKEEETHQPRSKTEKKQRKNRIQEQESRLNQWEIHGNQLEFSLSYSSLVILFILWTWGYIWWLKLCCLFFFCILWTKFTCVWVTNNFNGFLTDYICCCMFIIAFCFDSTYLHSLFQLEILTRQPKRGVNWVSKNYAMLEQNLMQILTNSKQ